MGAHMGVCVGGFMGACMGGCIHAWVHAWVGAYRYWCMHGWFMGACIGGCMHGWVRWCTHAWVYVWVDPSVCAWVGPWAILNILEICDPPLPACKIKLMFVFLFLIRENKSIYDHNIMNEVKNNMLV